MPLISATIPMPTSRERRKLGCAVSTSLREAGRRPPTPTSSSPISVISWTACSAEDSLGASISCCVTGSRQVRSPPVMDVASLTAKIRDIKDFPTEGILFKDITTLLKDGEAWRSVIDHLPGRYRAAKVDVVVGVESRGFIFGGRSEERRVGNGCSSQLRQ